MCRHHAELRIRLPIHHTHLGSADSFVDAGLVGIAPPVPLAVSIIVAATGRLLAAKSAAIECFEWIAYN